MLLQAQAFNTKGMNNFPRVKQMMIDASELGLTPGHQWQQLYDDAADVGIVLCSHITGHITSWYLHEAHGGEDITEWRFLPCPESVRKYPGLDGYVLRIIND